MRTGSDGRRTSVARKSRAESTKGLAIVEKQYTPAERPGRPRRRLDSETTLSWTARILAILQGAAVILSVAALYHVSAIENETRAGLERNLRALKRVGAAVDFQSERQRLLLGIQDEILKTNRRLNLSDAYVLAEHVLRASEKYPAVDPLLIVAVGIVESGYDTRATSHAKARGLYQIWPATGRLLARALEWEYTDDMLYDPEKNTELAALYLDILFAAYRDQRMVLAEYNGGPLNAGYLRAGSDRIALETRDYVRKVTDVHERLKAQLEERSEKVVLGLHEDPQRKGKSLTHEPDSGRRSSRRLASARLITQE